MPAQRGTPERIQVDNGPECVSKTLERWAYERGVELAFSRPGKPTDNAYIEAFNGRLRQECLNQRLARRPALRLMAAAFSWPRERMWAVKPNSATSARTTS